MHLFYTCENFRPKSLKVRSPAYVKWPYLRKSLNAHHSYTDWRTLWNFQRLIRITISTKCLSRNFDIDDLRSGQLCDLSITYMYISQVDKNERRLFRTETIINTLKYSIVGNIDTRNRTIAPSDLSFLSPMSSQVMKCWQKFFSAITLYIDLLERVEHLRGVQVDMQIDWYATWPFLARPWLWS